MFNNSATRLPTPESGKEDNKSATRLPTPDSDEENNKSATRLPTPSHATLITDSVPDDAPFSCRYLDHAPKTSHGTYLHGSNLDLEPLGHYQNGGYHPVHLGDYLGASGRYRVLHKLGYGGFGTVWLCRDTLNASYVAVKVIAGDVEPDNMLDLSLTQLDQSIPGAEYITTPLDHFSVDGPNGTHQCIVLPVLGPRVSDIWMQMGKDPGPILQKMAHQAAKALNFLHKNKFCHGDFRPSNILVKIANLDHLSEDELVALIGQPKKTEVRSVSGGILPASSPRYLVLPADIDRLGAEYLTDQICVIDFGESFPISSPPDDLGIPEHYLPPEVLLEEANAIGPACDLWALGCTLFEIREQIPLFYMIPDDQELIAEMVRFFGKLPEGWWDKWEGRADYFDEQGQWLRPTSHDWSLEVALSKPSSFIPGPDHTEGMPTSLITPVAEQKLMADLLYKLFRYEPGERLSTEEVLDHEWFKM
ncbi:hypothetical protein QQX98_008465 [Neonectria punicea]|uniref:EKC/KEOPS complex subunit BUD32 n=1 Tax=Neonectria punicea TaxID=979145 RepID=A0ABR1GUY9_9HYPO